MSLMNKGFTLIELLVVLGILGILAAALIATIDPFEQLKKSQDANLKNIAVEFEGSIVRYYTTHNGLPWWTVTNNGANCSSSVITANQPDGTALSTMNDATSGCLKAIIDDGELKQGFGTAAGLDKIFVTNTGPTSPPATSTIVCIKPQSKSQQKDPNTKYGDSKGVTTPSTCKSVCTSGTCIDCYWCTQ